MDLVLTMEIVIPTYSMKMLCIGIRNIAVENRKSYFFLKHLLTKVEVVVER